MAGYLNRDSLASELNDESRKMKTTKILVFALILAFPAKAQENYTGDATPYTCCAEFGREIKIFYNGSEITDFRLWNISGPVVVDLRCYEVTIPNSEGHNGITVSCYRQENRTFEMVQNFTHITLAPTTTTTGTTGPKLNQKNSTDNTTISTVGTADGIVSTSNISTSNSLAAIQISIIVGAPILIITVVLAGALLVFCYCRLRKRNIVDILEQVRNLAILYNGCNWQIQYWFTNWSFLGWIWPSQPNSGLLTKNC